MATSATLAGHVGNEKRTSDDDSDSVLTANRRRIIIWQLWRLPIHLPAVEL